MALVLNDCNVLKLWFGIELVWNIIRRIFVPPSYSKPYQFWISFPPLSWAKRALLLFMSSEWLQRRPFMTTETSSGLKMGTLCCERTGSVTSERSAYTMTRAVCQNWQSQSLMSLALWPRSEPLKDTNQQRCQHQLLKWKLSLLILFMFAVLKLKKLPHRRV